MLVDYQNLVTQFVSCCEVLFLTIKNETYKMKDKLKSILIVCSGFLTFIMSFFVPVGGGGISLILSLTIPVFIMSGIIFGAIYYTLVRKLEHIILKNSIFFGMLFLIIILTFLWYPYH